MADPFVRGEPPGAGVRQNEPDQASSVVIDATPRPQLQRCSIVTRLISSLGALALGLAATAASAVPIADLYNTGVNPAGSAPLDQDSLDSHYVFSVGSGTAVGSGLCGNMICLGGNQGVVETNANANLYGWTPNNATAGNGGDWNDPANGRFSRWLVPAAVGALPLYDQSSAGTYYWTTKFNISLGFNLSTASISGRIGADNIVNVYLNNNLVASSPYDVNHINAFSFTDANATTFSIEHGAGLLSGENTLRFEVTNSRDTQGSGNPTGLRTYFTSSVTPVPEPQTWALMGAGLALLTLAAYRRRATQGL